MNEKLLQLVENARWAYYLEKNEQGDKFLALLQEFIRGLEAARGGYKGDELYSEDLY